MNNILRNNKVQKALYGVTLIFWIMIWRNNFELYLSSSVFGIKYYWIMIVFTGILIGQILFNNKFLWTLIAFLTTFYTFAVTYNVFLYLFTDFHRAYISNLNFKETVILAVFPLTLILITLIIWKMKPLIKN